MNSQFRITGKCSICCTKLSTCKRFIYETLKPKSVFLLTSKLRIDCEKYDKIPKENCLICLECYEILHKFYKKVENKLYENVNLASINNLDAELRNVFCCLCKQHKKVLRPIELDIWMYNRKLMNKYFVADFEIDDTTCRNACLNCFNYLLFLATFYNTIHDNQKETEIESLFEEEENLITDSVEYNEEPRQGTSAVRKEVIELYKRDENADIAISSYHFLMADQLKCIKKDKPEPTQSRFNKFWRRIIRRSGKSQL